MILLTGVSAAVLCGLGGMAFQARANDVIVIEPIAVTAPPLTYPATSILTPKTIQDGLTIPYSDSGDFLDKINGITASRFGGHGIEPVIRGQSQNQLNIQNGDSYTFGACPNRMDPPTSYLKLAPHKEIKVVRGYQSVLNGFGGHGGSIIIENKAPDFEGDTKMIGALSVFGNMSGGYDSNSNMRYGDLNVTAGTAQGYAAANGGYKKADNYEDGDGKDVRSSFDEKSSGFEIGLTPEGQHIYAAIDYVDIEDALFPGAGMDSPYSESTTYKAGWEKQYFNGGALERSKISGYASLVDHRMDNFSLRPQTAAMPLKVLSESNTYGAKWEADWFLSEQPLSTLIEWRRNNRNADRIVETTGALQSLLWPDITIDELAIAAEQTHDLNMQTRLILGGRYDYVHVNYGRADVAAPAIGGRSANNIYNQFYGYQASNEDEHNLGGLIRLEHDYSEELMVYSGLSRSVRTADATERGLANFMGGGGMMSWVGNPKIKPEKHHQFDTGFEWLRHDLSLGGSAYANIVKDYILRDSARAQDAVTVNFPNADIYRNIDALLAGIEMRANWQMTDDWKLGADATYIYGQDIDAGRALPQIPPLQGAVSLQYSGIKYVQFDTYMRWAMKQNRVDTDATVATGRDVAKTSGYAVFDIAATTTYLDPVSLSFGVSNVFDKKYARHLNRSNISDPTEIQVNEPGRSFYVQLNIPF